MSKEKIIKAWKNAEFRRTLSASERASLPENPAGARVLSEDELEQAGGGVDVGHRRSRGDVAAQSNDAGQEGAPRVAGTPQAGGGFLSLFWCDPTQTPAPQPVPAPDPDPEDSTVWACTLSCCCSCCARGRVDQPDL